LIYKIFLYLKMESTKYLWLVTCELKPSKKYIYLNEKGDKIVGNGVSE
jgi:hypothetical protein